MSESSEPRSRRADAGIATPDRAIRVAWAVVGAVLAAWEIFLRVDSRAVGVLTKVWLLPLLGATIVAATFSLGLGFSYLLRRLLPSGMFRLGEMATLAAVAGILLAAEFVGVVHYHAPEHTRSWPLILGAGIVLALVAQGTIRRLLIGSGWSGERAGAGRLWGALMVFSSLAALLGTSVVLRVDVATMVLRKNTVLGQLVARPLARWPIQRLSEADDGRLPSLRLPDRSSQPLPERHDVLLISVDTLRADFLSTYDPIAAPTPAIDRLAAESIVFDDAFTQRATSAPSMASILTGLYPAVHTVRMNGMALPDGVQTLAESYRAAGFATAGFVTNRYFSKNWNFQQGFDTYRFYTGKMDEHGLMLDTSDPRVIDDALRWAGKRRNKDLFLWVHLNAPHSPYMPPDDLQPALRPGEGRWLNVLNMPFALARVADLRTYFDRDVYLDLYAAEVASVDRQVARLLAGLDKLGITDDAHVVFAADHGEVFGELDSFGHGHSLHAGETRIPLIWKLPGRRRAGTRIEMTVQAADIAPTLLRLAGLAISSRPDGRDISGVLLGEHVEDSGFAFSEAGYLGSLGAGGLKYAARDRRRSLWLDTAFPNTSEFDRRLDPGEADPSRYSTRDPDDLYAALAGLATTSERQLARSKGRADLSAEELERLRALGYIQ